MNARGCTTVAIRLMGFLTGLLGLDLSRPVTLSPEQLSLMLALAHKEGWERGYAAGQRQPEKPHGELWALETPGAQALVECLRRAA